MQVYAIDIVVSTGEGKPRVLDEKETTIYKRAVDVEYSLKLKVGWREKGEVGVIATSSPLRRRSIICFC